MPKGFAPCSALSFLRRVSSLRRFENCSTYSSQGDTFRVAWVPGGAVGPWDILEAPLPLAGWKYSLSLSSIV